MWVHTLFPSTFANRWLFCVFFHFPHQKRKKQRNSTYRNMNNIAQEGPSGVIESNFPLKAGSTREGCSGLCPVESGISPKMEIPPPL